MPKDLALAFAGHAPNSRRNVDFLLSDWLGLGSPDDEGYFAKPDKFAHITIYMLLTDGEVPAGLKPALNLVTKFRPEDATLHLVTDEITGDVKEWTKFVDHVHEPDDPFTFLISELGDCRSPYLMINWDEHDADDEQLIKLAHQTGKVKVVDLVEGLSEILPDEPEPQQEPQPEPERKKPAKKTTPPKREEVEELEPVEEELDDAPASTLEEEISTAQHQVQTAIAVGEVTVKVDPLADLAKVIGHAASYMRAVDATNAAKNLAGQVQYSPLTEALSNQADVINGWLTQTVDYQKTPALGSGKKPAAKPVKVVWDDDANEWKKAGRGRTRAGVRVGYMSEDGTVLEDAA